MKFHLMPARWIAVCLCLSAGLLGQSVQLRDGSILVGKIQDADGEGFTLLRTDNGGVLELRWSHLTKSSEKLIKTSFDLLNTGNEPITVRADVVRYRSSTGKVLEAVGRIVKRGDTIQVRRGSDVTPIPRSVLLGLSERQVTPYEIFTREDYYNRLLAEHVPGEDADKHLALGEKLMNVRDYARAEQHMRRAKELGGGRQPKVLERRLEHLFLLKGAAAEQELLDEIRTWTNRGDFKLAGQKIAEFKQKFASSKLQGELRRLELNYTRVRENKLVRDVARLWYKYVDLLANRKASDSKCTFVMAKQYGERGMGKEIREQIKQLLDIEVAEVEELWGKRMTRGASSIQHYHYSIGSWLLGPTAVLKDTKQGKVEEEEAAKQKSEQDKELERGLKRIEDALRRARQARQRAQNNQGGAGEKKEVTPEDWWADADRNKRATWLKAYYGEYSGDMEMIAAFLSPCPTCAGSGYLTFQGNVGQSQRGDCPVCHKTRFKRDIRVK